MFQNIPTQDTFGLFNNNDHLGTIPTSNPSLQFHVEIVDLILQETGTYNDHYNRPYKAVMSEDNINSILSSVIQNNLQAGAGIFASVAPEVLDIQGRVDSTNLIHIPHGWGETRLRFMLQVREMPIKFPGSVFYTFLQGFTESKDVSMQTSQINPDMKFFVNSWVRIQEYTEQTPNGPKKIQRVQNSAQAINGMLVADQTGLQQTKYMRPMDLIGKVQADVDTELRSGDVFDVRNTNLGGGNTAFNSYQNNTASHYLSRLMTPMAQAIQGIGVGNGHQGPIDTAVSFAAGLEPSINDSPFLMLLNRQLQTIGGATFSMNELALLDPSVGTRTHLRPVDARFQGALSARGRTAGWDSSTSETILATKLVNSIPGFMWTCYLGMISLTITNGMPGGRAETRVHMLRPITNIAPPEYVSKFLMELESMIARDISYNNQLIFNVDINASIIGDIELHVSINGGAKVTFNAPAFGAGILNPVYTRDMESFDNLASGLRTISDSLQTVYNDRNSFAGNSINGNI